MTDTLTPVLTANWDQDRAWTLAAYEAQRRLRRAQARRSRWPRTT